jgi:hypothetical protein
MLGYRRKLLTLFCLIIANLSLAYAQDLPVKVGKVLELCYQFKFKSADSLVAIYFLEQKSGEEVELQMLQANIYWWKIISGINDKSTKTKYYQSLTHAEKLFEKEKDKGNSHLYKGISIYGYMARMDGLNKNYLRAFFRINNCLKYLEKSFNEEAKYPFFYLSSGLYNYHIVVTAKQYPVLKPYLYLYPKGDKTKGLAYLKMAALHSNRYLSTEGQYFLMKIHLEEKNYMEAKQNIDVLLARFPKNGIFLYYKFNILLQEGNYNEANDCALKLMNELKSNTQISTIQINHFDKLIKDDFVKYKKAKAH